MPLNEVKEKEKKLTEMDNIDVVEGNNKVENYDKQTLKNNYDENAEDVLDGDQKEKSEAIKYIEKDDNDK